LQCVVLPEHRSASVDAKHDLMATFTATPYRPTGLATTDRALDSLVGPARVVHVRHRDSLTEYSYLCATEPVERELLSATADVLRDVSAMLSGEPRRPDVVRLNERLADSVAHLRHMQPDALNYNDAVHLSFHARTVAVATMNAANDALIATRQADPDTIASQRLRWRVASRSAAPCPTSGASWPGTPACGRCGSSTAPGGDRAGRRG